MEITNAQFDGLVQDIRDLQQRLARVEADLAEERNTRHSAVESINDRLSDCSRQVEGPQHWHRGSKAVERAHEKALDELNPPAGGRFD